MPPSLGAGASAHDWRAAFREADRLPNDASGQRKAERGRQFERILHGMLDEAGLRPRLAYRPRGEEVDGSFWMHGRTVLLEAKWTAERHPASSLYQFRGKVDGKLVGTVGLFVSMAGFSPDAIDALVAGKEVNLILADGADIRAVVDGQWAIMDALELKLRAAGESGTPFVPLDSELAPMANASTRQLLLVEGRFDQRVLELLRREHQASSPLSIFAAGGPGNMGPLAQALVTELGATSNLTVVLDGDGLDASIEERVRESITQRSHDLSPDIIVLRPDLDEALGLVDPGSGWDERRRLRRLGDEQLVETIRRADIARRVYDDSVARLLGAIGVHP